MIRMLGRVGAAVATMALAMQAWAWDLAGDKTVRLHARDGSVVEIGTVHFVPEGDGVRFELHMAHERFKDFFLSMKEFKCLEASLEIQCHVPYPYPNPAIVGDGDLRWLEHSLLFLYKAPKDFGAKLWNGIYYRFEAGETGLVGVPHAVDLNLIGAPPDDPSVPPFEAADITEIDPSSRWFVKLTID